MPSHSGTAETSKPMKVLCVKDDEGVLRPQAGIWEAESPGYESAVMEQWEATTSKKKNFQGCTLVQAELTELAVSERSE